MNTTDHHNTTEILLKVVFKHHSTNPLPEIILVLCCGLVEIGACLKLIMGKTMRIVLLCWVLENSEQ